MRIVATRHDQMKNVWFVTYGDKTIASIVDMSSRFAHDKWTWKFVDGFIGQGIYTQMMRDAIDKLMRLVRKIKPKIKGSTTFYEFENVNEIREAANVETVAR